MLDIYTLYNTHIPVDTCISRVHRDKDRQTKTGELLFHSTNCPNFWNYVVDVVIYLDFYMPLYVGFRQTWLKYKEAWLCVVSLLRLFDFCLAHMLLQNAD